MQRLLLVSPNWLGDAVFATAVIRAMRLRHPHAHLAVLCVPRLQEFMQQNPRLTQVIVYDERGRDRQLRGKWRLIRRLRRERFDAAIILRPSVSRTLLLWCAGIPWLVGHARAKGRRLLTHAIAVPATLHRAEQYLRLLSALDDAPGASTDARHAEARCELFVSDAARAAARAWLHAHGIRGGRPLVMVHPAGNWEHKRWPVDRFAQLADRLRDTCGVDLMVTGSPADVALARELAQQMHGPAVIAAGETTLQQLAALCTCADLIVTNDTGPLHIAASLDRPYLALFGPTSPAMTGPFHATQGRVLHAPDACPQVPCYRPDDPPHAGMRSLSVETVFDAAKQVLQDTRHVWEAEKQDAERHDREPRYV